MAKSYYIDGQSTIRFHSDSSYVYAVEGENDFMDHVDWTLSGSAVSQGWGSLSDGNEWINDGRPSITVKDVDIVHVGNFNESEQRQRVTLTARARWGTLTKRITLLPWSISDTSVGMYLPAEIYSTGETITGRAYCTNPPPFETEYNWSVSGDNVICKIVDSTSSECRFTVTGNYPSLANNKNITITARYGTESSSRSMLMKPSLTGVQVEPSSIILNHTNNYVQTIKATPLPIGTGAPINYTFTSSDGSTVTTGANGRTGTVYGVSSKDGVTNVTVTAALATSGPALSFSKNVPVTVKPNMRVYDSGFRNGTPYIFDGGSFREGRQMWVFNGSAFIRDKVR